MNYIVATYLVRFVGILLVIPALFPSWFLSRFPGLEDRRIGWVLFAIGIMVYAIASIVYAILRKRELNRHRAEMEELEKQ
jgi:predicted membrane channel-forming protein YqfA (hemolysin III family)